MPFRATFLFLVWGYADTLEQRASTERTAIIEDDECTLMQKRQAKPSSDPAGNDAPEGEWDYTNYRMPQLHANLPEDSIGETDLNFTTQLLGCEEPEIETNGTVSLKGTLMANDKSKGVTWLLDLATSTFRSVSLPHKIGNHETAVSVDGSIIAVPQYELVIEKGVGEGGGTPGWGLSLIDLNLGISSYLGAAANPLGTPKPHDGTWLKDGSLIMTAQEANGFVKYMPNGTAIPFEIPPEACNTPHLIRLVPNSNLAASGCRCTNTGCYDSPGHPDGNGSVVVFDVDTGAWNALPMGPLSEGLDITAKGDIWVGSNVPDGYVQVFTFGDRPRTVDNLRYGIELHNLPYPLRMAYDPATDKMAVASMDLPGTLAEDPEAASYLTLFDASSHKLEKQVVLRTKRGIVNMEGIRGFTSGSKGPWPQNTNHGKGYFITGGFDTQTVVVLDSATLDTVMTVYLPRCSTPVGFCEGVPMSAAEAKAKGETGSNNWSGGVCPATVRNPLELRWMVMDGFNWSPVVGRWAVAKK